MTTFIIILVCFIFISFIYSFATAVAGIGLRVLRSSESDKHSPRKEAEQLLQEQRNKHSRLSYLLSKPETSYTDKEREELGELISWLNSQ